MIEKFRKKPVVIDAVQFNGHNGYIINIWSNGDVIDSPVIEPTEDNPSGRYIQIKTLEGLMTGVVGDWIIKGVNGEFYPCKPDIFQKTYEPVDNKHPDCYSPEKDNPYPLCVGMFSVVPSFLKKKRIPFEKCKKCNLFVDFDERELFD